MIKLLLAAVPFEFHFSPSHLALVYEGTKKETYFQKLLKLTIVKIKLFVLHYKSLRSSKWR